MERTNLVARSRSSPWGFLVAFGLAASFLLAGLIATSGLVLPDRIGILVAPPGWFFGLLMLVFAAVLALVGIFELARWVKPSVEVLIDQNGVSTFGLLGAERLPWTEFTTFDNRRGVLTLGTRKRTRAGVARLIIDTNRLDAAPEDVTRLVASHRPDLLGSGMRA